MKLNSSAFFKNLTFSYAVMQCFFYMAICCVMPFASVFLLSRNFTNTEIGLTLACANTLAIITQLFLSSFADKNKSVSLKKIMIILFIFIIFVAASLIFTTKIFIATAIIFTLLLCIAIVLQGFYVSLAMEQVNAGQKLNFSLSRGLGSFSLALCSLILGNLTNVFGGDVIVFAVLILLFISLILLIFFPKPPNIHGASKAQTAPASSFTVFVKENKRFMLTLLSLMLIMFSHCIINYFNIQIVQGLGGDNSDLGIAVAIGAFIELPAMALFPFFYKKLKSASLLLTISGVAFVIKMAMTWLAPSVFMFFISQLVQFFAFATYIPAGVYFANNVISDKDKVKGQTYMTMAMSVSGIIANFTGGAMIDGIGLSSTLLVSFIVSAVGLIFLFIVIPSDKKQAESFFIKS